MMMLMNRMLKKIVKWLEFVAGIALLFVTLLSGSDIVGRIFKAPIQGAYEIISFTGGIVLGFAIPDSILARAHVTVDLIVDRAPAGMRSALHVFTRILGGMLFVLMGYASVKMAARLHAAGEYTPVLELPFYPVAYAMAGAFFVSAILLFVELTKKGGGANA